MPRQYSLGQCENPRPESLITDENSKQEYYHRHIRNIVVHPIKFVIDTPVLLDYYNKSPYEAYRLYLFSNQSFIVIDSAQQLLQSDSYY